MKYTGGILMAMTLAMLPASPLRGEDATPAPPQKEPAEAIKLGNAPQRWFHDALIDKERTHGVSRHVNGPIKIERVMKPEMPWEALGFIFYSSVVQKGGGPLLLYYGSYDAEKKKHLCVATSEDGEHWTRPLLRQREFGGNLENNILALDAVEAVVFDEQAPWAGSGYRMVYTRHWPDPQKAGVYTATSADGIHWKEMDDRMLPFVPDSQPSVVWDAARGGYVIFLRAWENKKRHIARVATTHIDRPWPYDTAVPSYQVWGKDKIPTLSHELPIVMGPDEKDPPNLELYTSVCTIHGGYYLAFPAAFSLYKGPEWEKLALPKTSDGPFDVQMAVSRDGMHWERFREPYIGTGHIEGVDLRLVSMGVGIVPAPRDVQNRRLLQYFVGWPYTHGQPAVWDRDPAQREEWMHKGLGGIYCATQRDDGFISMDAGNDVGVLVTKPLMFEGTHLNLNVRTAGIGSVKVALLDEGGRPLEGFAAQDCDVITGDSNYFKVTWHGESKVGTLQGKPVRVQFTLRNAKLFSWTFAFAKVD